MKYEVSILVKSGDSPVNLDDMVALLYKMGYGDGSSRISVQRVGPKHQVIEFASDYRTRPTLFVRAVRDPNGALAKKVQEVFICGVASTLEAFRLRDALEDVQRLIGKKRKIEGKDAANLRRYVEAALNRHPEAARIYPLD